MMKCVADVDFLGVRQNTSTKNGKTYYNVDLRSDGRNISFGTSRPEDFADMKEYQQIRVWIDLFQYTPEKGARPILIGNIVSAQPRK